MIILIKTKRPPQTKRKGRAYEFHTFQKVRVNPKKLREKLAAELETFFKN